MSDGCKVEFVPERSRYEMKCEGRMVGYANVLIQGERALFPYVEIAPELRGRELGGELVREALNSVRAQGLKPVPICPFVAAYLRRHPEFAG